MSFWIMYLIDLACPYKGPESKW